MLRRERISVLFLLRVSVAGTGAEELPDPRLDAMGRR